MSRVCYTCPPRIIYNAKAIRDRLGKKTMVAFLGIWWRSYKVLKEVRSLWERRSWTRGDIIFLIISESKLHVCNLTDIMTGSRILVSLSSLTPRNASSLGQWGYQSMLSILMGAFWTCFLFPLNLDLCLQHSYINDRLRSHISKYLWNDGRA